MDDNSKAPPVYQTEGAECENRQLGSDTTERHFRMSTVTPRPTYADLRDHATFLSGATILPAWLRSSPANLYLVLCAASSLGLSDWDALMSLYPVTNEAGEPDGLGVTAAVQRAMVINAGWGWRVVEYGEQRCTVALTRPGTDTELTTTYTWADAERAGLTHLPHYGQYPAEMMYARASTRAITMHASDVVRGLRHRDEDLMPAAPAPVPAAPQYTSVAALRPTVVPQPEAASAPQPEPVAETRAAAPARATTVGPLESGGEDVPLWPGYPEPQDEEDPAVDGLDDEPEPEEDVPASGEESADEEPDGRVVPAAAAPERTVVTARVPEAPAEEAKPAPAPKKGKAAPKKRPTGEQIEALYGIRQRTGATPSQIDTVLTAFTKGTSVPASVPADVVVAVRQVALPMVDLEAGPTPSGIYTDLLAHTRSVEGLGDKGKVLPLDTDSPAPAAPQQPTPAPAPEVAADAPVIPMGTPGQDTPQSRARAAWEGVQGATDPRVIAKAMREATEGGYVGVAVDGKALRTRLQELARQLATNPATAPQPAPTGVSQPDAEGATCTCAPLELMAHGGQHDTECPAVQK